MINLNPFSSIRALFSKHQESDDLVVIIAKVAHRALESLFHLVEIGIKYLIADPRKKLWHIRYKWSLRILLIALTTIGIYYSFKYIKIRLNAYLNSINPFDNVFEKVNDYYERLINYVNESDDIEEELLKVTTSEKNDAIIKEDNIQKLQNQIVPDTICKECDFQNYIKENLKSNLINSASDIASRPLSSFKAVLSIFGLIGLSCHFRKNKNVKKDLNERMKIQRDERNNEVQTILGRIYKCDIQNIKSSCDSKEKKGNVNTTLKTGKDNLEEKSYVIIKIKNDNLQKTITIINLMNRNPDMHKKEMIAHINKILNDIEKELREKTKLKDNEISEILDKEKRKIEEEFSKYQTILKSIEERYSNSIAHFKELSHVAKEVIISEMGYDKATESLKKTPVIEFA